MDDEKVRVEIGTRIREGRTYLALSQEELAKALDVPRSAISQIETGARGIDAIELRKLAQILGRTTDYLANGDNVQTQDGRVSLLARAAKDLSESDMGELQRFAAYLKSRSETEGS